ncbi:thioredoxin family protein [Myroides odoratimimus]|uniref:thioredoxin family protein n=1 Tax=Myroides odoratimimus TaxID=76832 RepID=UPI003100FF06
MNIADKIKSEKPTVVNFYATWCMPCATMKPQIEAAANELGDKIHFERIDIDQSRDLAEVFQVRSIPTTIIFKEGEIKWRQAGVYPSDEIVKLVEQILD